MTHRKINSLKRKIVFASLGALSMALAGCTANPDETGPTAPETVTVTETAAPEPQETVTISPEPVPAETVTVAPEPPEIDTPVDPVPEDDPSVSVDDKNVPDQDEVVEEDEGGVSREFTSALNQAQSYSDLLHMSKAGLYDQLTSEYGGQFEADAAQYAVDNVDADWSENALASARDYQDFMDMSEADIEDQLVSEYGGQFTPEEAAYAIDNL